MPESRSATTYRIAVKTPVWGEHAEEEGGQFSGKWIDYRGLRILGDYSASSPKLAVDAAIEEHGTPAEDGANVVAIPVGNWHEFPVGREVKPVYAVGEKLPTSEVKVSSQGDRGESEGSLPRSEAPGSPASPTGGVE